MIRACLLILFVCLLSPLRAETAMQLAVINQTSSQQRQALELLNYYRSKAIRGDAHAQFRVGFAYETGDGLPQNSDKASSWYQRAARQGHKNAIMNLAAMEEKNKPFVDVESEYEKTLKATADEGDLEARNQLARMVVNNVIKSPDYRRVFKWMNEQALADDRYSQYILAQMYEMGIAVPQNYIQAYAWYSVAAASGNELATLNRDSIATRMNQEQLQKGQEKSAELFESYVLNQTVEKVDERYRQEETQQADSIILDQEAVSQLP